MKPKVRNWLLAGAAVLAVIVFAVLPSMGPVTLADGRTLSVPGLRFAPSRNILSITEPVPATSRPLPVGTQRVSVAALIDGAPLQGGIFVFAASAPGRPDSGYVGRWTLWTKFRVDGRLVRESTFAYEVMTGSHLSTPTAVVTHAGVLDSIALQSGVQH